MALRAIQVKNLPPKAKTYRKFDGSGLYVEVTPKGKKYWRFKYQFNRKEKRISLGVFPLITLKQARMDRDEAKMLLHKGIDPSAERKARKQLQVEVTEHSFEAIAREWHVKYYADKDPSYAKRVLRGLEKDIFPYIGDTPIMMITASSIRQALLPIEERGAQETAHRMLQVCSRIFRYAHACEYCDQDPTLSLKSFLAPAKTMHFPAILDPVDISGLLRAMDSYDSIITRCALQLGAYTFVRPGNLRQAEWSEFDIDNHVWKIPTEKMKLRKPHLVPLSTQVIEVLNVLRPLTGRRNYLFPSIRNANRPMSEGTINAALRRLGYTKEQMTGHGFRHMASTILNEQGCWNPDAIERQLAHTDRSKIRGTYDHSKHIAERRKLMQSWADYLDKLKSKNTVIPFPAKVTHQATG
jgi:integrase